MNILIALVLVSLPATSAPLAPQPSDDCASPTRRQTGQPEAKCYAFQHDGRQRTFRVYMPANKQSPLPLLVALHGGGGTGVQMEHMTQRGFNRIADRDGVVIVYPDGVGKGWNDGRSDLRSEAVREQVDDIGFLRALPQAIAALHPVDLKRVYATGMSNGGLMSHRLGCDAADIYAAVAPVTANLSAQLAPRCKPSQPVSVAIINGTDDPLMPWDGGFIKVLWTRRGEVLSTPRTLARWMELNGCNKAQTDAQPLDAVDDETTLIKHRARCDAGTEVLLYEVRGGGHTWPGGEPYLGRRLIGVVSRELDANETIWQFFSRHRLP